MKKEAVKTFVKEWGHTFIIAAQTVLIAVLVVVTVGKTSSDAAALQRELNREKAMAETLTRIDANFNNLWTAVRNGSQSQLPAEPPKK